MPVARKPDKMFSGLNARGIDFPRHCATSYMVISLPWLLNIQSLQASWKYFLRGPYTVLSSGWSLWLVWGGKVNRTTPFAFALSITATDMCDVWLSMISSVGLSLFDCECVMKWSSQDSNSSALIHPLGFAAPIVPGGAPLSMWLRKFTRGNMSKGGILLPTALIAPTNVTSCPLSPDVIWPTCFSPFEAMTFGGLCTVISPVSSMLYILFDGNLYRSMTVSRFT